MVYISSSPDRVRYGEQPRTVLMCSYCPATCAPRLHPYSCQPRSCTVRYVVLCHWPAMVYICLVLFLTVSDCFLQLGSGLKLARHLLLQQLLTIRIDHWQGELRDLFERVQLAVRKAELHLVFRARRDSWLAVPIGHQLIYEVLDNEQYVGHHQPGIAQLAGMLPLFYTPGVLKALESVVETMSERDRSIVMQYETGITIFNQLNMVSVQKIQVFLLAYYYAILLPLIDASQLSIKESFGSYNWCDFSLFTSLEGIRARCGVPGRRPEDWDRPYRIEASASCEMTSSDSWPTCSGALLTSRCCRCPVRPSALSASTSRSHLPW